MKSTIIVVKEIIENKYIIWNLAKYEFKNKYAATTLGGIWLILNPMIQVMLFWFVFGLGIRVRGDRDDFPFIVWLLPGIIPWFYMSSCITQGATCISKKLSMVSRMNFPLSIVPAYTILSQVFTHGVQLVFIPLTLIIFRIGFSGFSIVWLLYGIFTSIMLLISLSFVTSTLTSIVRDLGQLIQHITRMLFWFTPIMWEPNYNSRLFQIILPINPVYHIVSAYRNAFLYGNLAIINWIGTLFFWFLVLFLLIIGTHIHIKFRREFIDYL